MSYTTLSPQLKRLVDEVIAQSPFKDRNGKKFILFCRNLIAFFIKSWCKGDYLTENSLHNYASRIKGADEFQCIDLQLNDAFDSNPIVEPLKDALNNTYFKDKARVYQTFYLLSENDGTDIDLISAIDAVVDLIKSDPENKYLYYLSLDLNDFKDSSNIVKIFDFFYNFEEEKEYIENRMFRIKDLKDSIVKKNTDNDVQQKRIEFTPVKVETPKFTLDNALEMVDNITTLDECMKLVKLINKSTRFLHEHGFDVNRLLKRNLMIDDVCGYPVVNDIDDIPSPFPEEIEGDERLANV